MGIIIRGTGKALPKLALSNYDLENRIDTSHQWIVERTGIEERHVSTTETGIELGCKAAAEALGDNSPEEIDLLVVATVTPDNLVPFTAATIKKELGLANAAAFDINTACSGFVYSLWVAEALMKNGPGTNKIKKAGGGC